MALRRTVARLQQQQRPPQQNRIVRQVVPPYVKSAVADLQPTPLERGSGAPGDPFNRHATNLASRAPESTVLESRRVDPFRVLTSHTDASVTVKPTAHSVRLTLEEWFTPVSGRPCPFVAYLHSLQHAEALPLSRVAQSKIKHFEVTILPQSCQHRSLDATLTVQQWRQSAKKLRQLTSRTLFDRTAFEAHLAACTTDLNSLVDTTDATDVSHGAVGEVVEILRRDAILERNAQLQQVINFVSTNSLSGGHRAWDRFFELVERYSEVLLESDDAVKAMWEVTRASPMPGFKPSAALLFLIVTSAHHRSSLANAAAPHPTSHNDIATTAAFLSQDEIALFAQPHLDDILSHPRLEVFRALGLTEAYKLLSASVAARATRREARATTLKDVAAELHNLDEARQLLQSLYNTGDPNLMRLAVEVGKPNTTSGKTVSFQTMDPRQWQQDCKAAALTLLCNPDVTKRIITIAGSMQSDESKKRRNRGVFTETAIKLLKHLHDEEHTEAASQQNQLGQLRLTLLQSEDRLTTLKLLQGHGVDIAPLHKRFADYRAGKVRENDVPSFLFQHTIAEVALRHPAWVTDKIVTAQDGSSDAGSASALAALLRIYLRAAYLPTNPAAHIANRHRGRVGPLAKGSEETNIETEFGFAEHFDVMEYKKYDWQGWYQRMVDVHNRNVSIRCKLSNLRVLDSHGKPLINVQSERRLRVLAGERVGNSIIKLDSDRFEDVKDNAEYGTIKFSELLSEAKKTDLGNEYWPSVEVKVRRPSGQSRMHYSLLDWDRVESRSKESFSRYVTAKSKQLFVPPTATWLRIGGQTTETKQTVSSTDGYTEDALFNSLQ